MFDVTTVTLQGSPTAIGSAGPYTLIVDRPAAAGGNGLGFNGGQLLYLAVAGCVSNDLFREAQAKGIKLTHVRIEVHGNFSGSPAVSEEIRYDVEVEGEASREALDALVKHVDAIAEIPNSLRNGTSVKLGNVKLGG